MALSQSMRGALTTLLRTLPSVLDSVVLITLLLVVYSTCGLLLFRNTEEGRLYFPNFAEAMVNMLVLLTTANYPDVMMPAYNAHRPSVLFFISFLLVGLFFCMNLVLASVYNNYKIQMTERAVVYHRKRRNGLSAAFRKLDSNESGFVRIASCARLLGELSRPSISMFNWEMSRYTSTRKTQRMLQSWWDKVVDERLTHMTGDTWGEQKEKKVTMDRPVDDLIPLDAFCDMMISVNHHHKQRNISKSKQYTTGVCFASRCSCCVRLHRAMNHYLWDWSIGLLVVINTLIIIIEADIDAQLPNGSTDTTHHSLAVCELLNLMFGGIYVLELILKICVLGISKYWSRLQHRFDTFTTSLVVVGEIIQLVTKAHQVPISDVAQYILLLRLTRTLRLVVVVRRFNEIFGIFLDLLPAFSTLFGMMWTVFSIYASVGMVLFGGKITTNSTALIGSDFAKEHYYSNNFNDFASSLVTLFELLVVNNWHVLMEGFVLVTSGYYRWYFISFWTIAVVVILNLVIAFVLEAFFNKDEQRRLSEGGSEEGREGGWSESNAQKGWEEGTYEARDRGGGEVAKEMGRGGAGAGAGAGGINDGGGGSGANKYRRQGSVINLRDGFQL